MRTSKTYFSLFFYVWGVFGALAFFGGGFVGGPILTPKFGPDTEDYICVYIQESHLVVRWLNLALMYLLFV